MRVSRQGLPTWVFFAGGAAVLVAIAVGVLALNRSRVHSEAAALEARAAAQKADEERRRVIDERSRRESSKLNMRPLSAGFEGRREIPKPGPGAAKEEVVNYVEYAIVKIQCYDWYNEVGSEGTGFVVAMDNGSALVATNYHVMRNAFRKADVLFNKGERYGVEGYVGVDPACDLAIVRLNGMPVNTQVLSLVRQTPSARDHVYAIGHPLGYEFQTTSGDIGQVLLTNELSADSQKFVRASLGNSVNHRWLAHDAPISPGNSGGPLLNAQGEVLGVNTWVDQQRKLGYALGVSHLERLLEQRFDEVVPLNRYFRPPVEMIVEDEGDQPEEELELNILHPDDFSTALKILGTVNFRPTNEGEFELLRDLSATMALVPRGRTSRQREALASALAGVNWDLASHAKVLNERAVAGFGKPQGIAFLGTVEKAVQQGAVLRVFFDLDGTNRRAYVPLSSEFGEVRAGAKWLVLGFCEVRELVTEEDGKQHAATTFRCQYMFPLPK